MRQTNKQLKATEYKYENKKENILEVNLKKKNKNLKNFQLDCKQFEE